MNTKTLLPLTAAALFAVCAGSMLISSQSYNEAKAAPVASHIVDLPTVTVRPAFEDAAYYQANKIVDLAAVTVRPAAEDLAYFLADNTARIVDMPVVTVRPSVEDAQIVVVGAASLAQQLASR
ncbi:MAG TPA: hypothetical protein VF471_15915 [Pseudoxanthomonas sp.]